MTSVKVTKIKKGVNVGDSVPTMSGYNPGNVGNYIEQCIISSGHYNYNTQKGVDLPDIGVEVKTRNEDATSPQTIGRMTIDDIKNTPYEQSSIYEKIQTQYRVKHRDGIITEESVYDFSDPMIQDIIEESYETARKMIIEGNISYYIRGKNCWGYFEKTSGSSDNLRDFRLPNKQMKEIEKISKNAKHIRNLFDF
jgi:hypothetical protein